MKITSRQIHSLTLLAITLLILSTFGLAAIAKWQPMGIPDNFIDQFGSTWLASLPGGLILPYFTIAITETLAALLVIVSLAKREFLSEKQPVFLIASLILSLFIFVILGYGLRLTGQFGGTANTFFYFGATLLCLMYATRQNPE